MPRLAVAQNTQIDRISQASHSVWGGGLSVADYIGFWNELSETAWASRCLNYYVWEREDGEVLSSFKLYRPAVRFLGENGRAAVLGAVFTPAKHRRQGHAVAMMRQALDEARERGDDPALLFSDIGTAFYSALGFRALPAEETWGRLGHNPPAPQPGWEFRDYNPDDLDAVHRAHDAWCRTRPLAIRRDCEHWEFLLLRTSRFFDRLGNSGVHSRFRIAMHRGEYAGYLITVEGHGEWSVREVGAEEGDPAAMASILECGAADARRRGLRRFYAWLPREVTDLLPGWKLQRAARNRAVPMVLPLSAGSHALAALASPDAAFFPYQDQF